MKKKFFFFISIIFMLAIAGAVHSQTDVQIKTYVTDNAGVFSERAAYTLEENLRQLEKDTNGVQFVIFTEKKIPDGTTLEERSLQIAEQNGVGKKGADNGILFYLATEDRQFRWEVGYGMEATLNSPLLGRVSRDYMIPEFKNNNFEGGILNGVDVIKKIVLSSSDPDVMKQLGLSEETNKFSWADFFLKNWVFWLMLFLFITSIIKAAKRASKTQGGKNKKPDEFYHSAIAAILLGGRPPRGGMGGGGFGGGGFGGFSGGGGSFGGGGFSGKF